MSPAFKKWFGKSKVVDAQGRPLVVYHGTTHVFTKFSLSHANADNYLGRAFYFTDSRKDVNTNYLEKGPDITSRIEDEADRIMDEEGVGDRKKAVQAASKKIRGSSVSVMAVYLKMENPLVLDPKGGTQFDIEGAFKTAVNEVFSPSGDEILSVLKYDLGNRRRGSAYDIHYVFKAIVANTDVESYSQLVGETYRKMGYDGVILDADAAFGAGQKKHRRMKGVSKAKHYVVWEPDQIKSATGNDGSFDVDDPDIRSNPGVSHQQITGYINQWIKKELQNWKNLDDLIHQGFCADLASGIYEKFGPDSRLIFHNCSDPCHTWIEFDGKHYDLQNPNGVSNWKQMKYFKDSPDAVLECKDQFNPPANSTPYPKDSFNAWIAPPPKGATHGQAVIMLNGQTHQSWAREQDREIKDMFLQGWLRLSIAGFSIIECEDVIKSMPLIQSALRPLYERDGDFKIWVEDHANDANAAINLSTLVLGSEGDFREELGL